MGATRTLGRVGLISAGLVPLCALLWVAAPLLGIDASGVDPFIGGSGGSADSGGAAAAGARLSAGSGLGSDDARADVASAMRAKARSVGLGLDDLAGTSLLDARSSEREGRGGDGDDDVDYGYDNTDPLAKRGRFFDPRDLAVLSDIIALNELDESSSAFDYDDGDGVLDPTELGRQVWCDGRLRLLELGPSASASFGYQVRRLPESISRLQFVVVFRANASGLEEIPPNVADMASLQKFEAFGNGITEVPEDLGVAPRLRELNLNGNRISEVPDAVFANPRLEAVFVSDNPLIEVPALVERQMGKMRRGERVNVVGPIERFGRDCVPGTAS